MAARTTNKRPKEPMEKLRDLHKDREVTTRETELLAANAALEEEKKELQALLDFDNSRLDQIEDELEDVEYLGPYVEGIKVLKTQLAASQLHAEQLRVAIDRVRSGAAALGLDRIFDIATEALALPRDTSALDAYVDEKVKEIMK